MLTFFPELQSLYLNHEFSGILAYCHCICKKVHVLAFMLSNSTFFRLCRSATPPVWPLKISPWFAPTLWAHIWKKWGFEWLLIDSPFCESCHVFSVTYTDFICTFNSSVVKRSNLCPLQNWKNICKGYILNMFEFFVSTFHSK